MAVRILPDQVVNQIAAGEVVDRPASVVKELVENALDAGARRVEVHLGGGGSARIRVVDDGAGMDRQDALLCLERHATSKIERAEDLSTVRSLGFRGEALPSIASVSRFTLTTRTAAAVVGTCLRIDGGKLLDVTDAGGPPGTEVDVRGLFHNLPVRRKFLRSTETELGHCSEALLRLALPRPDCAFELVHEGRTVWRAPVAADRAGRARDVLGDDGMALFACRFEAQGVQVEALASPVGVHRATALAAQRFYVNGRFVRDAVLRAAVGEAYRDLVPKGRHPVVALFLDLDPARVDINVHPSKTEVRFRDPRAVGQVVGGGLRDALQTTGLRVPTAPAPRAALLQPSRPQPTLSWPSRPPIAAHPDDDRTFVPGPSRVPLREVPPPGPEVAPVAAAPPLPTFRAGQPLLPVPRFRDMSVIGQLDRTYLLCEGQGELVIIDQHAAHERVRLYELTRAGARVSSQRLMQPHFVPLSEARQAALGRVRDRLVDLGVEAEPAEHGWRVTAMPATLSLDPVALLQDLADGAAGDDAPSLPDDILGHMRATMACHSAVRAHQTLSAYEMRALLASLDEVDFEVCAHGRPVAIRIGVGELERRFHRS